MLMSGLTRSVIALALGTVVATPTSDVFRNNPKARAARLAMNNQSVTLSDVIAPYPMRDTKPPPTPVPSRRHSINLGDIKFRALKKWVAAGMPNGDSTRFWEEAERELVID
jgi:hypothetical protein